ncbi:hypothetical protein [Nonomuraea glycinis]|uniref:hypothetical protein n=1 Tax=Nonomuraea glycinis TaxID=2047744 RepID=UPI002E1235B9|nr:hypothetical protein OHA68_18870 [Nonomuraea glycinis]
MAEIVARLARHAVPALAVAAALLIGAVVWLVMQARDAQARADDRQAALLAAGTHAVSLLSLDHRTVEADLQRILATSTGAAKAGYEAGASKLRSTTVADKVVQEGVLRAAGLVSLSESTAKALVVADVEIRWDGSANAPQERFYRWSMDLTKVSGTWLVSKAVQVS